MSENKKEAEVITFSHNKQKYQVLGKRFCFQGKKYTAKEAVQNKKLVGRLVADKSPAIKKIESAEKTES
jgi:hypothetical protein